MKRKIGHATGALGASLPPSTAIAHTGVLTGALMAVLVTAAIAAVSAFPVAEAQAAERTTVVSVVGEAWQRTEPADWQAVESGQRLPDEAWVRTGEEAAVRLIRADGSMIRIDGGQEQQLMPNLGEEESEGLSFFRMFREIFSGDYRARAAASRAIRDVDSFSSQVQLAQYYESEWTDMIHKARLNEADISRVFEAASFYGDRALQNRAMALTAMLARDFPQDAGFAVLAQQSREALGSPGTVKLIKRSGGGEGPIASGDSVQAGDGLRLSYRSETESYVYLYLHSIPASGPSSTTRVYPARGVGWATEAKADLHLPGAEDVYTLDEAVGLEHFWVWSCAAPLTDKRAENEAVANLRSEIDRGEPLTAALVLKTAPAICTQGFAYVLDHR